MNKKKLRAGHVARLAVTRNKHKNYAEKKNVILEQAHRLWSLSAFST
jgi:hypothetical protein